VTAGRAIVGWTAEAYGTLLPKGEMLFTVEQPASAVAAAAKTGTRRKNEAEILCGVMANPYELAHL
jgi:hypothetical protein